MGMLRASWGEAGVCTFSSKLCDQAAVGVFHHCTFPPVSIAMLRNPYRLSRVTCHGICSASHVAALSTKLCSIHFVTRQDFGAVHSMLLSALSCLPNFGAVQTMLISQLFCHPNIVAMQTMLLSMLSGPVAAGCKLLSRGAPGNVIWLR